ncbi:M15 family metallopeptidase [Oceanobacillus rekensis]|uniref:M15 family metallopeptidase n=1 Tax=Oceanobacillus rekensis TaxID=937927 RepID=UPI000B445472|nr:M15 family metallopeptidase [Oceanobacillus rekensis]
MKGSTGTLVIWIILIIFLVILFFLYNQLEDEDYLHLGTNAPMPTELHPIVEERKNILVEQVSDININIVITEEIRTFEEQDQLYEQGRTTDGNIVTNARGGESYHNYGLAIDYALENEAAKIIWDVQYDGNNNGKSDWFEVADIAKELGFEWGGDFRNFRDYPHLQMTFDLSLRQLQSGIRPSSQ